MKLFPAGASEYAKLRHKTIKHSSDHFDHSSSHAICFGSNVKGHVAHVHSLTWLGILLMLCSTEAGQLKIDTSTGRSKPGNILTARKDVLLSPLRQLILVTFSISLPGKRTLESLPRVLGKSTTRRTTQLKGDNRRELTNSLWKKVQKEDRTPKFNRVQLHFKN